MRKSDYENIGRTISSDKVDRLNSEFYGKYPYPWRPIRFDYVLDPNFYRLMLNQSLGDWENNILPENPNIWVAGCGTNQAVFTALKFPQATVLGSDLSGPSLELCARSAKELNIEHLELRQESLNQVTYEEAFDYIICTGVIHHNAEPQIPLRKLMRALKSNGIIELMVYNRFHRTTNAALQKAIQLLVGQSGGIDFDAELSMSKKLLHSFPVDNLLAGFLQQFKGVPESMLADGLIQPVEYSYTVESLNELAASCQLELLYPCIVAKTDWHVHFDNLELQQAYDMLPDVDRWQVTNLLLFEESPMLWFYLQRQDNGRCRKSEQQICEAFLDTVFRATKTTQRAYVCNDSGQYTLDSKAVLFPSPPIEPRYKQIVAAVDGKSTMREIFARLKLDTSFHIVNQTRSRLTSSTYPYLQAVREGEDITTRRTLKKSKTQKGKSLKTFKPHAARVAAENGEKTG